MTLSSRPAVRPRSVVVVGAGIVGLCCARFLQRDGHRVVLIDPREPGTGASFGNAGIIATCQVWPIAMPGILSRIPLMLLDPDGPVVLRWRYLPRLAPWLLKLVMAARPQRVERTVAALAALLAHAVPAYDALLRPTPCDASRGDPITAGAADLVRRPGWLKVYATARGFAETAAERRLLSRHGVRFEVLTADEIRQLEPALAPLFSRGLFFPDCGLVLNPKRLVDALLSAFLADGGRLVRERAVDFALAAERNAVLTERARHEAEVIVLAAGAWSRPLAARLGARVPLDTERGYHLMFDTPAATVGRPTQWGEYYFNLVPMEHGLRMTSGVEFAGLAMPPDYRRIERLARLARIMLPSLPSAPRSRWLGFRPSLPDSLPVLGRSARHEGVYFAFGHQHLGLTLGAVSGRITADLVAGRNPGLDLSPHRAERW
ncbi:MAG TPA: FAD-dependent oxidoreductase [Stellaceae bacterium]|nr:FAD-dependent oxidoreductase [Stellaceae bacterium]